MNNWREEKRKMQDIIIMYRKGAKYRYKELETKGKSEQELKVSMNASRRSQANDYLFDFENYPYNDRPKKANLNEKSGVLEQIIQSKDIIESENNFNFKNKKNLEDFVE